MTTPDLARLAIETLDAQKLYFAAKRRGENGMAEFEAARVLERRLRKAAESCLDPQPRLFGEDQ